MPSFFRDQLEKSYKLCDECALILKQTLQTQHYIMLGKRLNGYCPVGVPKSPKNMLTRYRVRKICFVGSTSCLVVLLLLSAHELLKDLEIIDELFKVK